MNILSNLHLLNHHIRNFIATWFNFKLVEYYYFMAYSHWYYSLFGRYYVVIFSVTSGFNDEFFIYWFLFKSWRSNCLERGNNFVSRTKLSNLLHCKIIKYCLIGAESLSVSNIYLILVCWVQWEGHAFKLREWAWLLWVARAHLAAICKHVVRK